MNAPLSLYLTSFTAPPRLPAPPFSMDLPDAMELPLARHAIEDEPTISAAELEARLDAARAEADRLQAEAIAALRLDHEAATRHAIEAARAEWVEAEGQRLTSLLDDSMATLKSGLEHQIADVLRPFLKANVLQAAMTGLADALGRLLADARAPIIHVRGPADLLERLARLRPESGIDWSIADIPEIEITADAARIETKLAAALSAIATTES